MNPFILPVIIATGIAFYAAAHYYIIYLFSRERENLSFAVACLSCGVYDIFCVLLYGSTSLAEGMQWQRLQFAALAAILASLIWFTRHLTGYPSRIIVRAFTLFFVLDIAVILAVPPEAPVFFGSPLIKTVRPFCGTTVITYYEAGGGPLMMLQNIAALVAIILISFTYIRHGLETNRKEGRFLLAGMSLLFACGLNDMLVNTGVYTSIYLIEYGFLMLIIGMGHTLAYRHSETKKVLRERNDELTATTEELEATNEELLATNEELVKNQEDILQLNRNIAASEELFRAYFEESPIGMAIFIPPGGTCTRVNHRMSEMLGYSEEEMLGRDWRLATPPDNIERDRELYSRLLTGKTGIDVHETRLLTASGTILDVALFARGLYDSGGRLMSVLVLALDITDRKKAEDERERIHAQLMQSQKMEAIGILAGGVAHDFNNLLTAIIGTADLAIHMTDTSSESYAMLRDILHAASRAADLTRQMLLFSRHQPVNLKHVHLDETIASSMKMINRIIGENIRLSVDTPKGMQTVFADESQIEQIIMNLVINARDAMPGGGDIAISASECEMGEESARAFPHAYPGTFIRLSFTDTGTGMDHYTQEHIFEPFFTTKKTGQGSGLGLSVVYGIVKKHRGWINVTSSPGKGSTFDIYLPVSADQSTAGDQKESERRPLQGNGELILLVEDQQEVADIARTILEKNNYTVRTAPTGAAARELFAKEHERFDLLFTDIVLPDINGHDLAREISSKKPGIGVLLTSGYPEKARGDDETSRDVHPFLAKPYSFNQLLEAVRAALGKARD